MANLNFAQDLFLDVQEMEKFNQFITTDLANFDLERNSKGFGIIYNRWFDPKFNYFKVTPIDNVQTLFVNNGFAYDQNRNLLTSNGVQLVVPQRDTWYWLQINYNYSNVEQGTVSIGGGTNNNMLVGVGTKFTETLRGEPNFPSVISFGGTNVYTLQYEVLEVVSDTVAYLQGSFITSQSNLTYSIVGTFTPGVYPPASNQYPFQYDSCDFTFVPEITLGVPPSNIAGEEFYIARVNASTSLGLIIQDQRRLNIHQTKTENYYKELPTTTNPLIAVESVNLVDIQGALFYQVQVCHGFRVMQQQLDLTNDIVNIISGNGGAFKNTSAFQNGNFDGWRYYYNDGSYSRIISSVINNEVISLYVDTINQNSIGVMVCPNAEEVEYTLTYVNGATQTYFTEKKIFYSFTDPVQFLINSDMIDPANKVVLLSSRYKTLFNLSGINSLVQNTYPLQYGGNITSANAILGTSSAPPASTTYWVGTNPYCIQTNLGGTVYYKITTQNPQGPTNVYQPNSTTPVVSTATSTVDILVQFYSDAGMTTPVSITQNALNIFLKSKASITSYIYGSIPMFPTEYQSYQETLSTFTVNVNGNSIVLSGVPSLINNYSYPTNNISDPQIYLSTSYAYVVFPFDQIYQGNNGFLGYSDLAEYYTNTHLPTGNTKYNSSSDPDYIPPSINTTSCPFSVPNFSVNYGYNLDVESLYLVGSILGPVSLPSVANTSLGNYKYLIPQFQTNENVSVQLQVNTTDPNNTSGYIWLRIVWIASGSTVPTYSNLQIPINVLTNISMIFQNIQSVSISNS